jgi:hypothetical protein
VDRTYKGSSSAFAFATGDVDPFASSTRELTSQMALKEVDWRMGRGRIRHKTVSLMLAVINIYALQPEIS